MIRNATMEDVEALVKIGQEMHAESAYADISFDADKVLGSICQWINNPNVTVIVYETSDGITGGIACASTEYFFSREKFSCDLGLFVRQSLRGGMAAVALIKAFLIWSKSMGCLEARLGITTGVNVETTSKLYERLGFEFAGPMYVRRL